MSGKICRKNCGKIGERIGGKSEQILVQKSAQKQWKNLWKKTVSKLVISEKIG